MPIRAARRAGPGLARCQDVVDDLSPRAGVTAVPRVRRTEWYRSDIRTAETRPRRRGRSTIAVSQAVLDATDAQRRGVLAHEVCHVRCDRPGLRWWGYLGLAVAAVPLIAAAVWGTTAGNMVAAEARAMTGFCASAALLLGWALLLAPHARVDRLPSMVRELRCDLLAADLTSRDEVIAGLMLLARLTPDTPARFRLGSPSHPAATDRARAVAAYPGAGEVDPIAFAARFLLEQAHHAPVGRSRRRVAAVLGERDAWSRSLW